MWVRQERPGLAPGQEPEAQQEPRKNPLVVPALVRRP